MSIVGSDVTNVLSEQKGAKLEFSSVDPKKWVRWMAVQASWRALVPASGLKPLRRHAPFHPGKPWESTLLQHPSVSLPVTTFAHSWGQGRGHWDCFTNLCGANARPTDELSLARGGWGEQPLWTGVLKEGATKAILKACPGVGGRYL